MGKGLMRVIGEKPLSSRQPLLSHREGDEAWAAQSPSVTSPAWPQALCKAPRGDTPRSICPRGGWACAMQHQPRRFKRRLPSSWWL